MKFLVPIIVGAIIGYITNWLAIKMLFRPYTKKKIFGIPIPFTPGLIPKEMNRIAKSIGEAVGKYLLSAEVISGALSDGNTKMQMKSYLENVIQNLKLSNESIKDLFKRAAGEKYNSILSAIEHKITELICSLSKSRKLKDYLTDIIRKAAYGESNESFYNAVNEKLPVLINKLISSDDLKQELKRLIDNRYIRLEEDERPLNEVIPEDVVAAVKNCIMEHDDDILKALRDAVNSLVVKRRIKNVISEIIEQNVSKLVTIFMSADSITDRVFESIEKYLENQSSGKDIVTLLDSIIDKLLQKSVSSIFSGSSFDLREESTENVYNMVIEYINDEKNQNKLTLYISEKIKNISKDAKDDICDLVSGVFDIVLSSPGFSDNVGMIVHDGIMWALNQPVSALTKDVSQETIDKFACILNDLLGRFVKNKLPYFIELINIPKIVEDRINAFNVEFAEEIIIGIADRELKAITWLGALLGGIMGILTPLIMMLY